MYHLPVHIILPGSTCTYVHVDLQVIHIIKKNEITYIHVYMCMMYVRLIVHVCTTCITITIDSTRNV